MDIRNYILEAALEEANSFAELPAAWKKKAVKMNGGRDSKVEVIAKRGQIKKANLLMSTVKKAIGGSKNYVLTWVEFRGKEIFAIEQIEYARPAYRIILADGASVEVSRQQKQHGTDKYSARLKKYIPPVYHQYKDSKLNASEAINKMEYIFLELAVATKFGPEATIQAIGYPEARAALDEIISGADVSVKGITVDEDRRKLQSQRKDAKSGVGTADQANKKAVIRKILTKKLEDLRKKMESSIPDISKIDSLIDIALAGKYDLRKHGLKVGDLSDLETTLKDINTALSDASSVAQGSSYYDPAIKFGKTSFGGPSDGKKVMTPSTAFFMGKIPDA